MIPVYDIEKAFRAVEDELMKSMIRNMKRHCMDEINEEKEWEMWQTLQLKSLEEYKQANRKKFQSTFSRIDKEIAGLISEARSQGNMEQEIKILQAIKKGFKPAKGRKGSIQTMGEFFKLNDRKLDALIEATQNDFKKAEQAVLRMSEDQYRQVIFNAQVYANTGAGTYEKAVDMATKDFLSRGINCIQYANGARHTITDYADMAIKTATKRAYLVGEGEKRKEWGITTVIMNKRGNACPKCLPFVGKVLIDDVWSGGKQSDGPYMLMSYAMAQGLYHPRCKDVHTTYFEGISTPGASYTENELLLIENEYRQEQKQQYAKRQEEKFGRLAKYSLDEENKTRYQRKVDTWKNVRFKIGNMSTDEYVKSKRPLANFHPLSDNEVVNILREKSEEWIKNLTDEEIFSLRKYTKNSGDNINNKFYKRLNAMLRGDGGYDERLEYHSKMISKAIKKNNLPEDVVCYRSMDINPYEELKAGDILKEQQFISTSVTSNGALKGKYSFIIYVKKGSRAAYIENLSRYKKQRELLIDKNNFFRVISNQGNVIKLEVL